jgi:hypothetical protein
VTRLAAVALLIALAWPAMAEWTETQRKNFLESCLEGCQSTPDLSGRGKLLCPKACECVADEGEKIMTPDEMDEAEKAAGEGKTTAKLEELDKAYPMCVRRAAGR